VTVAPNPQLNASFQLAARVSSWGFSTSVEGNLVVSTHRESAHPVACILAPRGSR
jgi:hypothetical protein